MAPLSLAVCAVVSVAIAFLGKADASIFDVARAKLSDFTAPALNMVREPLAAFEHWTSGFGTLFSVYQENIELKRENAELRKWQNVALSLEDRLKRYETLMNAAPGPSVHTVTARVIGESNRPFVRTMIINAGEKEGVKKGQAVVDNRGLIGRIFLTGEQTSWVILLTDLNSRLPVMIEPTHRRAILAGDNTSAPQLELDVSDGAVQAGARALTTSDGGMLPPDLPIGVTMEDGGAMRVALFASADASDFVQVLDYGVPADPPKLSADSVPAMPAVAPVNAPAAAGLKAPVPMAKPQAKRTSAVIPTAVSQNLTPVDEEQER